MGVDTIIALFLIGMSAALYKNSLEFPAEAGIFPKLLLVLTIGLSAILLIVDLKKVKSPGTKISLKSVNWRPYIIYAAALLYVLGIVMLGFFTATVCFLVPAMFYLGIRSVTHYVIAVPGIVLFFYFLFVRFLHVPLPHGLVY